MEQNECRARAIDEIAADFGLPDSSYSLYDAVVRIVQSKKLIHDDSATISLEGDGTPSSPLIANLQEGAVTSTDGSIIINQGDDGVIDLSTQGGVVTSEDSPSVTLNGEGTQSSPLVASLAPTAITSSDNSVTVTQQLDGTFDLQVPSAGSLVTQDSDTITLSGDGTALTPLEATLASGAITSSDSTVTVTQQPDDSFDLSVEFTSPDSSIAFTPTNQAVVATTFTGSTSIDVVETPGTAITPPDYTFSLSPTAIIPSPNPSLTPVDVVFTGGQFQLGVALATGGVIPRTVIVGGEIGSTPNAATIFDGMNLISSLRPPGERWTLLILPGEYGGEVSILDYTNIVALIPGSVVITSPSTITANGNTIPSLITISGIRFSDALDINGTLKGSNEYVVTIRDCVIVGQLRMLTALAIREVTKCELYSTTCYGGVDVNCSLIFSSSRIIGALLFVREGGLFQATGSAITANAVNTQGFISVVGCVLGGDWFQNQVAEALYIHSCRVLPSWTLVNYSTGPTSITDTTLRYYATQTGTVAWRIDSPNLPEVVPPSLAIDRDLDCVITIPTDPPNLQVSYQIPFQTNFTPAILPTIPPTQTQACTLVIDGKRPTYTASAFNPSGFQLANSLQVAGTTPLTVSVRPPSKDSTTWFVI